MVIQTLNTIVSLLCEHIFKLSHAIVAAAILALLVLVLCIELVLHLCVQVSKLLIVSDLVGFQRIVHFFTLINRILLDVLDLSTRQKIEGGGVTRCS